MNAAFAVIAVFAIIFVVPIAVYGALAIATGLAVPGGDAAAFLAGVAVSKLGTAIAFVGLWMLVRPDRSGRLWPYVLLWWVMFVTGEIGQALGPGYSWTEALGGILSESIYLPLAGLVLRWRLPGRDSRQ